MVLYYNPDCSKCREAADHLQNNSCEFEIREYLKIPPTVEELKELLKKLGCKAEDITRKSEPLYMEKFAGKKLSEEELLKILSQNPILIERPILIEDNRAIIGRPPVRVLEILNGK